jgi:hypothetical protein
MSEGKAHSEAKKVAEGAQLKFIYQNCKTDQEFRNCCEDIGLSATAVQSFLNEKGSKNNYVSGSMNGYGVDTAG